MSIQHSGSPAILSCRLGLDGGAPSEYQQIELSRILQEAVIQASWPTTPGMHSVGFECSGGGTGDTREQGQLIAWTD